MSIASPLLVDYPAVAAYVASLDGSVDLWPVVQALPETVPMVWLDSARRHRITGRFSVLGYDPWMQLVSRGPQIEWRIAGRRQVVRGHPLEALRRVLSRYAIPVDGQPYGRALGLLGWLSYDLNRWIERLPEPQAEGAGTPEMMWFGMRGTILVDHLLDRSWVVSLIDPHQAPSAGRRAAANRLEQSLAWLGGGCEAAGLTLAAARAHEEGRRVTATASQAQFERMVLRALESIRAGDIFQANLSQRFTTPWRGCTRALYQSLRAINPSPFAALVSCDELAAVSCSPERLVRVEGGRVETRPIAGTRPRGADAREEAVNTLELLMSEKERAEHLMLVDLSRNDLGRVCRIGTVAVDELMALESYSHVLHIVSNVSGRLRPGVGAVDVIRAVFPGGTITGCPKVRCMEILRELEPVARGLYTGSLGYIAFDGRMDLNIAIRTMVVRDGMLSFHVGAGIVADSVPEREYHETLAKGAALLEALQAVGEEVLQLSSDACDR